MLIQDYKKQTDREVWREFRKGNERAFSFLYSQYVYVLYQYGNRITPDRALIEDAIQDLFIELWRNRATLGETDSIKFYLYKALKRKLVRKLVAQRGRALDHHVPEEYDFEMALSPEFVLIAEQISQEQRERLLIALNSLTPRQKEAITLKFYDGLSYQEVSVLMAMSVKSTYNLIYRAIEVLKTHLEKGILLLIALLLKT